MFKQARSSFMLCANCGYTQREKAPGEAHQQRNICPLCQSPLVVEEILDPPAFAPERAKSLVLGQLQNDGSSQGGTMTQVKLVLPLTDAEDFGQKTAGGRVAWSYAEHRELLIANSGVDGKGFSACCSCGTAAPGDPAWLYQMHDRPFLVPSWIPAPRKCNGADGIWHGYLGHIFHSDLLLLRFRWPSEVAYHVGHPWMRDALDTIAQAILLASTRLLDIATTELQVGWSYTVAASGADVTRSTPPRMADFFLFDTLSGGAGYATQIGHHIESLLSLTQNILTACPDRCEGSCYRCLRTYANRILHHHLDRHLAGTLLQAKQLETLRQFLELVGVACQHGGVLQGVNVPMLVTTAHQTYAVGTYPVQQERKLVKHPLDVLPARQVRSFSDYELAHNLPNVAQSLLI